MSIPPNNPPPGNYGSPPPPPGGYYSAPPPPKSGSSGCWKAVGITCGVLLLLFIIIVVAITVAVKKSGIAGTFTALTTTTQDGELIRQAIVKYHSTLGKYPDALIDLVPSYLPDAKVLHSDLDLVSKSPGHVSWKYFRPNEGDSGRTPLLELGYKMTFGSTTTPQSTMIINLDGTTSSAPGRSYGSPSGGFKRAPGGLPGSSTP